MVCDPKMAKMMGGAFACPTSEPKRAGATFRTTKAHDTRVASNKRIHETSPNGMTHSKTAGM
jgi:hypothetical protein